MEDLSALKTYFIQQNHIPCPKRISQIPGGTDFIEKSTCFHKCFFLVLQQGLEPWTPALKGRCSTY